LVKTSFVQLNPAHFVTNTDLSAYPYNSSYKAPTFSTSNGVATLTGGAAGPIELNTALTTGSLVLISGHANPYAGGLYGVENVGNATTRWQLWQIPTQAGVGAQLIETTNLTGVYSASRNPGAIGSTLTGTANGALNSNSASGGTNVKSDFDKGDVLLLNGQTDATQNGVYQITAVGSPEP
jgi:hypothetical protein